jgi:hypothetical protein
MTAETSTIGRCILSSSFLNRAASVADHTFDDVSLFG